MGDTFLCRYLMMVNPLPLLGYEIMRSESREPDLTSSWQEVK